MFLSSLFYSDSARGKQEFLKKTFVTNSRSWNAIKISKLIASV